MAEFFEAGFETKSGIETLDGGRGALRAEGPELEELVRELDAILDAWFMSEVAPALDEAAQARAAVAAASADAGRGLRVA